MAQRPAHLQNPIEPVRDDWSWVPDPVILAATLCLVAAVAFADTVQSMGQEATLDADETRSGRVFDQSWGYSEDELADTGLDPMVWAPPATFLPE